MAQEPEPEALRKWREAFADACRCTELRLASRILYLRYLVEHERLDAVPFWRPFRRAAQARRVAVARTAWEKADPEAEARWQP